jgi:arabinosaccharide transport system permease protein
VKAAGRRFSAVFLSVIDGSRRYAHVKQSLFHSSMRRAPYIFVLPFIISVLLFYLYPIIGTIVMSFQDVVPGETRFIGAANYQKMFSEDFYKALGNSFKYTAFTILILIPLPVILAVMLNTRRRKTNAVYRAVFFLPSLVSVVVAGTIFRLMFAYSPRAVTNAIILVLGGRATDWVLGGAAQAMFLMVMLAVWRWTGVNIVYFLSGLQSIPTELYEAADIDGARPLARLLYITLPLLKPTVIFVTTISIFGGFAMFEESYIFWQGQSPNNVGLTMVGLIYKKGFQTGSMGLASSIGIVLMAVIFVVSLIALRSFGFFKRET